MRISTLSIIALSAVYFEGAISADTLNSSSVCKKRLRDGAITDCEISPEMSQKLGKRIRAMRVIDENYPGPKMPSLAKLYDVASIDFVDEQVNIKILDGDVLMLAGIECSADMAKYLRSIFFQSPKHKIIFVLTGDSEKHGKYAYMWDVEKEREESTRSTPIQFDPTYSSVNETGIMSGWCTPIQQKNHAYHDRYLAVSRVE